jgi:hypothetical protein
MGWANSSLRLILLGLFLLSLVILLVLYKIGIKKANQDRRGLFNLLVGFMAALYLGALFVVMINPASSSFKELSFDGWICGDHFEPRDSKWLNSFSNKSGVAEVKDGKIRYYGVGSLDLGEFLNGAGIKLSADGVSIALGDDGGNLGLSSGIEKDALAAATKNRESGAWLEVKDGDNICGQQGNIWNMFKLSINHKKKSYSWKTLDKSKAIKALVEDSAPTEEENCLILDYGQKLNDPLKACLGFLREGFGACLGVQVQECKLGDQTYRRATE